MLASNRFVWDIGVYNPHHELVLIVEVKTKLKTTPDWVVAFRKNIFSSEKVPNVPYFLMAFPDTFYLWTEKDLQQNDSQPTYIIDARPMLDQIYEKVKISDHEIAKSSLQLIIASWLRKNMDSPQEHKIIELSQNWLIESGLYSAIVDGHLLYEVTA